MYRFSTSFESKYNWVQNKQPLWFTTCRPPCETSAGYFSFRFFFISFKCVTIIEYCKFRQLSVFLSNLTTTTCFSTFCWSGRINKHSQNLFSQKKRLRYFQLTILCMSQCKFTNYQGILYIDNVSLFNHIHRQRCKKKIRNRGSMFTTWTLFENCSTNDLILWTSKICG